MGFGVFVLRSGVSGLGFGVWGLQLGGLRLEVWGLGLGFRVWSFRSKVDQVTAALRIRAQGHAFGSGVGYVVFSLQRTARKHARLWHPGEFKVVFPGFRLTNFMH